MTPPARTVYYFAYYLYVIGLMLVFLPNLLLQVFLMPVTNEVWIRVAGVLVFNIGFYYHRNSNNIAFLRSTVPTRLLVFITFTMFVILDLASPVLMVFGAIDGLGAVWTWYRLRRPGNTKNH